MKKGQGCPFLVCSAWSCSACCNQAHICFINVRLLIQQNHNLATELPFVYNKCVGWAVDSPYIPRNCSVECSCDRIMALIKLMVFLLYISAVQLADK